MRVLIVGCGYVGLPLGAELVRRGHEVFGLRRTPTVEEDFKRSGIIPVLGDITRLETLQALPAGYDWIVNCVSASGGAAEEYRRVYLEGTRNLLAWLASTPPKKFVYTSSTSVYGQTGGEWVDEASPTRPLPETARILLETEAVLLAAAQRQFSAIVLRLAGIYGPGRGYWLKQFLSGEARLEGKGTRILNMIHRDDVVGAILAALEKGWPGEIYNVADDEPVSQLACFQWLAERLGKPLPASVPEEATLARKRGVTNKKVSNRKLKTELNYRFKYPTFREGFESELRQVESHS